MKKLSYETKELMVQLSGNCFWYWASFYSFLKSCGVSEQIFTKYPKTTFNKYDVMRNVLDNLESNRNLEAIQELISGFYRLTKPVDTDVSNPEKATRLLKDFKSLVGNDPIERAVKQKESEKQKERYQETVLIKQRKSEAIVKINKDFLYLLSDTSLTPQNKGFKLEKLFYEILSLEEFDYKLPYKTKTEQIDGRFKFDKFDYLVEIKFESSLTKQKSLGIFDTKIKSKAQSTRGFFLATNGFDISHLNSFKGNSPRLILMDGQELMGVLEGRMTFYDLFTKKVDELVKTGEIYTKIIN